MAFMPDKEKAPKKGRANLNTTKMSKDAIIGSGGVKLADLRTAINAMSEAGISDDAAVWITLANQNGDIAPFDMRMIAIATDEKTGEVFFIAGINLDDFPA